MAIRFCTFATVALVFASAMAAETKAAAPAPRLGSGVDCANASSAVEKAICSSDSLSESDRYLTKVYGERLKRANAAERQSLVARESLWIRNRDACVERDDPNRMNPMLGDMRDCISGSYEGRIAELEKPLRHFVDMSVDAPDAKDVCSAVDNLRAHGRYRLIAFHALQTKPVAQSVAPKDLARFIAASALADAAQVDDTIVSESPRYGYDVERLSLFPGQPDIWLFTTWEGSLRFPEYNFFLGRNKAKKFLHQIETDPNSDGDRFIRFRGYPFILLGGYGGIIDAVTWKRICVGSGK